MCKGIGTTVDKFFFEKIIRNFKEYDIRIV